VRFPSGAGVSFGDACARTRLLAGAVLPLFALSVSFFCGGGAVPETTGGLFSPVRSPPENGEAAENANAIPTNEAPAPTRFSPSP